MMKFRNEQEQGETAMTKEANGTQVNRDSVVSIIGPGMRVVGNCETEGTLRIEGIVEGTVRAGKAVVIGKDGSVKGDVYTQDAIVGGNVTGTIVAESRLELQATCLIEGEIRARRVKLEEGGRIKGNVQVGELKGDLLAKPAPAPAPAPAHRLEMAKV
jgi:cytoskeletal protein CcmA (bactofilin family)